MSDNMVHCDVIKLVDESELIVHWVRHKDSWKIGGLYHEMPLERDHNGVALAGMLVDMSSLCAAINAKAPPFQDLWKLIDEKVRNHQCKGH